jgi:riboflavin synthase
MFTGIIESLGLVKEVEEAGTNRIFRIESPLATQLKPDQSVAHNGVCLTVEEVSGGLHRVSAVRETLEKTTLGAWQPGKTINLERSMALGARLDGHWVQGHVDVVGTCIARDDQNGSWKYRFSYPRSFAPLLIEKGSIALEGISLTVFEISEQEFSVAIIPFTFSHTSLKEVLPGMQVNLEFDVLGKYVQRLMQVR